MSPISRAMSYVFCGMMSVGGFRTILIGMGNGLPLHHGPADVAFFAALAVVGAIGFAATLLLPNWKKDDQ